MNHNERLAAFYILKYGSEPPTQEVPPMQAVGDDFESRVRAIAQKTLFLENELEKGRAVADQIMQENEGLQGEIANAQQIAQQAMMEAQQKGAEGEQMAQALEEYKQAIINITNQMPSFGQEDPAMGMEGQDPNAPPAPVEAAPQGPQGAPPPMPMNPPPPMGNAGPPPEAQV